MRAPFLLTVALGLVACGPTPVDKAVRGPSGIAEIACLGAVSTRAGAAQVGVVGSEFAPSGTKVTLYVDGAKSNTTCVATEDGQVLSIS